MVAEVIQGREEERVQTLATVRVPRSGREGVKEGLEKRKSATTSESMGVSRSNSAQSFNHRSLNALVLCHHEPISLAPPQAPATQGPLHQ